MSGQYFINSLKGLTALLAVAIAMPAYAGGALVITSESLQADRLANTAVFEGAVVARGDNMVLSASRMTVSYEQDGSLKTLVAEGSVKMIKGLQVLTSQRAVYDLTSNSMVFTGEPRAIDEGSVLMGDAISYFLDDDRIKVDKSTMFIDEKGRDGKAGHE